MRIVTKTSVDELPIDVADARRALRIDSEGEDIDAEIDIELLLLIGSATELCETRLRRAVAINTYELEDECGLPHHLCKMHLPWPDVTEVGSVVYTDALGDEQTIDPGSYKISCKEWLKPVVAWPPFTEDAKVTYTAGWGEEAPDIVKHWILLQVGYWFRNKEAASTKTLTVVPYAERLLDTYKIVEV